MGIINANLPADGSTADVADYNNPINTIVTAINGGLDNDNIKAAAGIDPTKLAFSNTTDANGWTVYNYGILKLYLKSGSASWSLSSSTSNQTVTAINNLPTGMSDLTNVFPIVSSTLNVTTGGANWVTSKALNYSSGFRWNIANTTTNMVGGTVDAVVLLISK